jgi:acetylornithine deacetylase/succinyl-diaminopimelate desuccinylase family protein
LDPRLLEKVMSHVDENFILKVARELIAFKTVNPPGDEEEAARYVAGLMEAEGLRTSLQFVKAGRPNAIGELCAPLGERLPTLLLNGHLDVVPPGDGWRTDPFEAIVRNGRLYGRGAADMKGGLASILGAVRALARAGAEEAFKGCLRVAAVVDEERGGTGTRFLLEDPALKKTSSTKPYMAAVVCEPTNLEVQTCHKGTLFFSITVYGRSAHGSQPERGINAIYGMMEVIQALRHLHSELREKRRHPLLGTPSLNVGTIHGGTVTNAVPDKCVITVDTRLIPGEKVEDRIAEIEAFLEGVRKANPQMRFALDRILSVEPAETPPEADVVTALLEAQEYVLGSRKPISGFEACCDASSLVNLAKIPTAIFGPGSLQEAHTANEFVEISQLSAAAKCYAFLALRLLTD